MSYDRLPSCAYLLMLFLAYPCQQQVVAMSPTSATSKIPEHAGVSCPVDVRDAANDMAGSSDYDLSRDVTAMLQVTPLEIKHDDNRAKRSFRPLTDLWPSPIMAGLEMQQYSRDSEQLQSKVDIQMQPAKQRSHPWWSSLSMKELFMWVGALTLCMLMLAAFVVYAPQERRIHAISIVVCVVYIAFSVTIDISIALQKEDGLDNGDAFKFNPACAVIVTEAIKLVVSLLLLSMNKLYMIYTHAEQTAADTTGEAIMTHSDAKWLMFPAALFTANNLLVYHAIGQNDLAAFGIFRDTMILFTAGIWYFVFRTPLGNMRIAGIAIIFAGLAVNRTVAATNHVWSWAFVFVMLMTLCNSVGSVANEFALKRSAGLDINLQNAVLYMSCMVFSILVLMIEDYKRLLGGPSAFFFGFTQQTLFTVITQAIAGLLVSRLLKYADAVTKTVACCLRGPLVVLIAPHFVHSPNDFFTCFSAFIVASGCFVYLSRGRLETSTPPKSLEAPNKSPVQS